MEKTVNKTLSLGWEPLRSAECLCTWLCSILHLFAQRLGLSFYMAHPVTHPPLVKASTAVRLFRPVLIRFRSRRCGALLLVLLVYETNEAPNANTRR